MNCVVCQKGIGANEPRVDLWNGSAHWHCDPRAAGQASKPDVYGEIRAERAAQIAKGRDAAHDNRRSIADWMMCRRVIEDKWLMRDTRRMWVKIAAMAVAAIEAIDRSKARRST